MLTQQLLTEFIEILGKDQVILDKNYINEAQSTTYKTTEGISVVLHPHSVSELQKCIVVAHRYKQPVYTVSNGKNWGYGSRVPVTNNNVLIELKYLNRIVEYDEKQAYITVEPGVSFMDAFRFLRQNNSELILSTIGGAGTASLIGNALERGIGTGLYADRFSHVCGLEVLLPDGSIIATGLEHYGNFKTGKLFRWGNGPSLDGLFSQSNFGIITKMTIWLMKPPPKLSLLFYKVADVSKIPELIDVLQNMLMEGLVRPTLTLYNDVRVISSLMQYPFAQTNDTVIDSDLLMERIKQMIPPINAVVGYYNGEISIRSFSDEHAEIQINQIKERLEHLVEDLTVVNASKKEIMQMFADEINPSANSAPATLQSFLLKKYIGIPDNSAIKQAYWRKRKPAPADMNPDRDKCGLIWICPVIPFDGKDAAEAIDIIKTTIKRFSFEPAISFQCTSERCINIIASFGWDREIAGEDEMAEKCYLSTVKLLSDNGYFSYRSTTLSMHHQNVKTSNNSYDSFLSNLKRAMDPHNILSPEKYVS